MQGTGACGTVVAMQISSNSEDRNMSIDRPPVIPLTHRQTVLVVDDGDVACDMLARLLRLDGYHALTAGDGQSALTAVEVENPDLVLLDLTMPDMDGLEVLRRLRADGRHEKLPVVMFTAVGSPWFVAEALRLGAADYVVKGGDGLAGVMAAVARHLPVC